MAVVIDNEDPRCRQMAARIKSLLADETATVMTWWSRRTPVNGPYWVYNTEPLQGPGKMATEYVNLMNGAERVLDYSQPNTRLYARSQFMPIRLVEPVPAPPADDECDIDVLFYGYLSPRRRTLLEKLAVKACVLMTDCIYGDRLTDWIRRSKVVLCVNSYDGVNNNSMRSFPALEVGARLVSEQCEEPWYNDLVSKHAVVAPYDRIYDACLDVLRNGWPGRAR